MLLTSAGGESITLVQATIVVILTPSWNPFVDMQMASRADRIGQTKHIQIYQLVNQESIELRVRRFQKANMEKTEKVLSREAINDALKHTQHWTNDIFMEMVKAIGSQSLKVRVGMREHERSSRHDFSGIKKWEILLFTLAGIWVAFSAPAS